MIDVSTGNVINDTEGLKMLKLSLGLVFVIVRARKNDSIRSL